MSESTKRRLYEKLEESEAGCWEFMGARDSKGYGRIWHINEVIMAHRASWMVHRGPIPIGIFVLHDCDNPSCFNPAHLFLGTADDNTKDMMNKGRHKIVRNPILNADQVIEIRNSLDEGIGRIELAIKFSVSLGAIDAIKHRRNWRHI